MPCIRNSFLFLSQRDISFQYEHPYIPKAVILRLHTRARGTRVPKNNIMKPLLHRNTTLSTQNEMPQEAKEEGSDTHINLKVSDGSGEIFFKIKRTTPMKRLMDAFCKRQGRQPDSVRFLIDGTRIHPDSTPQQMELEDGDVIEAHREQTGGCM